jgi:hypothetical protein
MRDTEVTAAVAALEAACGRRWAIWLRDTTSELSRYRREIEHAIEGISPAAQVRADLRRSLDAVVAEQEDRARAAKAAMNA